MPDDILHHLRIKPDFDGEFPGITLFSNYRTLWFSLDMWQELILAVEHVKETNTEWRNYEDPERLRATSTYTPPATLKSRPKPTLNDVLDLL